MQKSKYMSDGLLELHNNSKCTKVLSSNLAHGEVYSAQRYVIHSCY